MAPRGYQHIEDNKGIQSLVQLGQSYLKDNNGTVVSSNLKIIELLGVCQDLHRKYLKSCSRGQVHGLDNKEEAAGFESLTQEMEVDRRAIMHYISLFSKPNEKQPQEISANYRALYQ